MTIGEPSPGHRPQATGLSPRRRRQPGRDIQKMLRVCGSCDAVAQNKVIASLFSLDVPSPGGKPNQRIEPIQRTCKLCQQLSHLVASFDMSELVQQHRSELIVAPFPSCNGQQQSNIPHAPDNRNGAFAVKQQGDVLSNSQLLNCALEHSNDRFIRHVRCLATKGSA